MRQLMQDLSRGKSVVLDAPAPSPRRGTYLIRTRCSVISAGTERMLLDFGRANWMGKALQQPERLRAVLNKVRMDGPIATWLAIRTKLEMPIEVGYCNVGDVVDSGGSTSVLVGQRVVSNSAHAEIVSSPHRLAALVPDSVTDEAAGFVPLAAIALEGIDLLQVRPRDQVVVVGLGLIGQLAVRILRALGCEVLGIDPNVDRRAMAEKHGATIVPSFLSPVEAAIGWSRGHGVAGVLITASSSSNEVVSEAARSCRYRGRVVLVGVVGLQLNRADFYRNEVSFQVSCSYGKRDHTGPGSVQANFCKILELMNAGKLPVDDLITHRFSIENGVAAYEALRERKAVGIVLDFRSHQGLGEPVVRNPLSQEFVIRSSASGSNGPLVALLGAGNFALRTILPTLKLHRVRLEAVVSNRGSAAIFAANKFGASWAGTSDRKLWSDRSIQCVFITTRHDAHTEQAVTALESGKSAWVEKPLCLSLDELERICDAIRRSRSRREGCEPVLMVGFNRRFAPISRILRAALVGRSGSLEISMKINAGRLEPGHWTLNPEVGGGRIVGECCHFVDLARFLVGSTIQSAKCLRRDINGYDGGCFELQFANNSQAIIDYRTDLPAHVPKEHIQISGEGFSAEIYNWSRLTSHGLGRISKGGWWSRRPRKGHAEALGAFLSALGGSQPPIPISEIIEVSAWAIQLQAMKDGQSINLESIAKSCTVMGNLTA